MQSSKDFLQKLELKEHKHEREMDLYDREVDIKNHVFTHKFSSYCLQTTTKSSKYNYALHSNVDKQNIFETNIGVKMVKYMTEDCRLGFGEGLQFDPLENKILHVELSHQFDHTLTLIRTVCRNTWQEKITHG